MSETLATTAAGVIPVIVLAGIVEIGVIARATEAAEEPVTDSVEAFVDEIRNSEDSAHRRELIADYRRRRKRGGELHRDPSFAAVLGALWAAMIAVLALSEFLALDYLALPDPSKDPMADRAAFLLNTIAAGMALLVFPPAWRWQQVMFVPYLRRTRADWRVWLANRRTSRT